MLFISEDVTSKFKQIALEHIFLDDNRKPKPISVLKPSLIKAHKEAAQDKQFNKAFLDDVLAKIDNIFHIIGDNTNFYMYARSLFKILAQKERQDYFAKHTEISIADLDEKLIRNRAKLSECFTIGFINNGIEPNQAFTNLWIDCLSKSRNTLKRSTLKENIFIQNEEITGVSLLAWAKIYNYICYTCFQKS